MTTLTASTQFINVLVKVKPGSEPGQYNVHTAPAVPYVTQPDTVINYQIYDTGGRNIIFTGMTVTPTDNDQLSPASVSVSGKLLTFSDANSSKITLNITLNFIDEDGVEFMHDPQVQNEPTH
ncbi:hypothetical protein NHH82_22365 [Oxalobacteraceae bacterium OTU3REALA1]|nr:hypothetical protein NHH82_22365 [Oxalobacteraceae bacterium OTU3REALA1]